MSTWQADLDDQHQDRLDEVSKQFGAYLAEFDFNGLDELTADDFLGWFYDQENYVNEFIGMATRSHFWIVTQSLDVATDYAEHLINMEVI